MMVEMKTVTNTLHLKSVKSLASSTGVEFGEVRLGARAKGLGWN